MRPPFFLSSLRVSLHGMDVNSRKRMANYLDMCCKNEAFVVEDSEAQAEIVDADQLLSFDLLKERMMMSHPKPIIAISIRDVDLENVIYLKKPIKIEQMLDAITKVKGILLNSSIQSKEEIKKSSVEPDIQQAGTEKELNIAKCDDSAYIGKMSVKELLNRWPEKFRDNEASVLINDTKPSISISEQEVKESAGLPDWPDSLPGDVNPKRMEAGQTPKKKRLNPQITENSKEQNKKDTAKLKVRSIPEKTKENIKNRMKSKEYTDYNIKGNIELITANKNGSQKKIEARVKPKSSSDMRVKGRLKIMTAGSPLAGRDQVEIDKMLKDLRSVLGNIEHKLKFLETKNRRKIVRYGLQTTKAKLIKRHLIRRASRETVYVLNVSSKGALVRLKKPAKFNAKVSLKIYFDRLNIFDVPARVVRKEGGDIYGLQFLKYQHQLADYLVESKKALIILN